MTLTTKLMASAAFLALSTSLAAAAPAVHYGGVHPYRSQTEFHGQRGFRGERQYRGEQRAVRGEQRGQARPAPQAQAIGGNNPMKNEKSTSSPNLPRSQGQAAPIGGNNAMKNEKSTTAAGANEQGTRSVTNARASRGNRRATTGAGANR